VLSIFASVAGFAAFAVVLREWPPARAGARRRQLLAVACSVNR